MYRPLASIVGLPTAEPWQIEHGIRFTAMPSYKGNLTEEQIWQIAYFLKNLPDHLPPAAQAEWHKPVTE